MAVGEITINVRGRQSGKTAELVNHTCSEPAPDKIFYYRASPLESDNCFMHLGDKIVLAKPFRGNRKQWRTYQSKLGRAQR